jgi:hypothetical protein
MEIRCQKRRPRFQFSTLLASLHPNRFYWTQKSAQVKHIFKHFSRIIARKLVIVFARLNMNDP